MQAEIYTVENLKSGRLSIMAHPRGGDWLEDEIKALSEAKVDVLVSLLTRSEIIQLNLNDEPILCQKNKIEFISFPIADREVPPFQPETFDFFKRLHEYLAEGRHVTIHCRMGIGRSALVAASLLVLNGISSEQAFDLLMSSRGLNLPDTFEQRDWVSQFEHFKKVDGQTIIESVNHLLSTEDYVLQTNVIKALGYTQNAEAIIPLLKMYQNDDKYIRTIVIIALGQIGGEQALEKILDAALNDPHNEVRNVATSILSKYSKDNSVVDALISNLKDADYTIGITALTVLIRSNNQRAIKAVMGIINNRNIHQRTREQAIITLSEYFGGKKILPLLIFSLADEEPNIRFAAAFQLGEFGGVEVVEPLIRRLKDSDVDVRANVVRALGKIGNIQALPPLLEIKQNDTDKTLEGEMLKNIAAETIDQIKQRNNS